MIDEADEFVELGFSINVLTQSRSFASPPSQSVLSVALESESLHRREEIFLFVCLQIVYKLIGLYCLQMHFFF